MARADLARPENVPGDFFVDTTCIDCDACRWIAPATFAAVGDMSAVVRQPAGEEETDRALMALVACPTASIGTRGARRASSVRGRFPDPVGDGVHHCGYHAEASFGAASWLAVRPEGNVLVDSPRFTRPLVQRLEELGGVATMFLTHVDDVADHARFAAHFGCERVLHADDARGELRSVERLLEGAEPVELAPDLLAIPVPGHTRGSTCLLWRGEVLFTGDHLAWSPERERLVAFRRACWYDWRAQTESMRRLAEHGFERVLPGHGRAVRLPRAEMARRMADLVAWMERAA